MQNFFEPNGNINAPGHHVFYFQNANLVGSLVYENNVTVNEISPAISFYQGYASTNTLEFNHEPEDSPAGIIYPVSLRGICPYYNLHNLALMEEMTSIKHVVLLKDNNGMLKLIGRSGKMGLNFKYKPAGAGFEFEFYRTYDKPIPFYTGTVMLA